MTNTTDSWKLRPSYKLDERDATALARLADQYADDLPAIQQRDPIRIPAVVDAVIHHQARRLFPNLLLIPPAEPPEDRAEDIADALSLLQAAREYLEDSEAALLAAASPAPAPAASPCLPSGRSPPRSGPSPSRPPRAATAAR